MGKAQEDGERYPVRPLKEDESVSQEGRGRRVENPVGRVWV